MGIHFCRDLASSSFLGPDLFGEEVLAKVIAASRVDTHLPMFFLSLFSMVVGVLTRRPPLVRVLLRLLLSLLPGVGEEVPWILGVENVRLLQVQGGVVL